MASRRQEYGLNKTAGIRSSSVVNFRNAMNSGSFRRSSAVLPSVLTFLVIVASGGLLLMIEKGMLNGIETPPPRGSGRRLELMGQADRHSREAVDVESQVTLGSRFCPVDGVRVLFVFVVFNILLKNQRRRANVWISFGSLEVTQEAINCSSRPYCTENNARKRFTSSGISQTTRNW